MKERIKSLKTKTLRNTQDRSGVVRKRHLFSFFLFLCIAVAQFSGPKPLYAQPSAATAPDDRARLLVRHPDAGHLSDLQTDHDYQYTNEAPPPENPVARFFDWLFRKLRRFLSSSTYQNVWQYVILAGIAGAVVYLLMKADVLSFLFPRKALSATLDYENLAENIHEIDFDSAVDEAVNQYNFRLAVRLLYLQTLKRLTDAERIDYKPDKTNQYYVYELAKSPLQADFERLTHQFEFIWYGDFPIDEPRFRQIQEQFKQFGKNITSPFITRKS